MINTCPYCGVYGDLRVVYMYDQPKPFLTCNYCDETFQVINEKDLYALRNSKVERGQAYMGDSTLYS